MMYCSSNLCPVDTLTLDLLDVLDGLWVVGVFATVTILVALVTGDLLTDELLVYPVVGQRISRVAYTHRAYGKSKPNGYYPIVPQRVIVIFAECHLYDESKEVSPIVSDLKKQLKFLIGCKKSFEVFIEYLNFSVHKEMLPGFFKISHNFSAIISFQNVD